MKKLLLPLLWLFAVAVPSWAVFPLTLQNNSQFADEEIFVAIVGEQLGTGNRIYYNLQNNSAANVDMPSLSSNLNTLHKQADDWGFANIFVRLSDIPNKTIYIDQCQACRMFFGFKSPMYLHVHENGSGYAGADLNNPSDPNADLRWEVIEFTYDQNDVMFVNTTRVDAFQYPMGIDLYGNVAAGANNAHMRRGDLQSYTATINQWRNTYASTVYNNCLQSRITHDALGPIIMQPSKVAAVKNTNAFDSYIDQIWNTFTTKTLRADMGERGVWYGRVENGVFVMHNAGDASQVATVGRPTTTDVIEGAGTFATGNWLDKAVQAQFCGAMNRGMIMLDKADNELQYWGDRNLFFTTNTYNEYVAFFHRNDLSHDGYTYAFAYDDTFDQSSTCATSHPASLHVSIGGFTTDPGSPDVTPSNPSTPSQPAYTNNVAFANLPASLESATNYTLSVDYSAAQDCEVMVCLFKGEWNVVEARELVQNVTTGSGNLTFSFAYNQALVPGNDYIWKCEIRPIGGNYANHYMEQLVRNYTITPASSQPENPSEPEKPSDSVNPSEASLYCQTEVGHFFDPNAAPNSFVLLSIGADGKGNTIVRIDQDADKNSQTFDYLQVTGLASTGTDTNDEAASALAVSFPTPTPDAEGYITLEILWSNPAWNGRWMVQNVKVLASATCQYAVLPSTTNPDDDNKGDNTNPEDKPTDVSNLNAVQSARKVLIDGSFYIIRGEHIFNAAGAMIE